MWILQFLPNWIFYLLVLIGVLTFLIAQFAKIVPQAKLIQAASLGLVFFGTFMTGAITNNDAWLARVRELETKVAEAEAKSQTTNTEIVEKTVFKTRTVRERSQDTVKYIDREVVKHDSTCVIPQEFVQAHNRAAEAPK
jgi:hypothetical protein